MEKETFILENKEINIFNADCADYPCVWLNTYGNEGEKVEAALLEAPKHTLITISNLEWDKDMSPWDCPPLFKGDTPCTGGADDYLKFMTDTLMPKASKELGKKPNVNIIAGYSLAGLFAIYAMYKTDVFQSAASMSGSLWFPKFTDFAKQNNFCKKPDFLYFSLGDKEAKTKNPILKQVQINTEELEAYFKSQKIDTIFELNPGNHFVDGNLRQAKGIKWVLDKYAENK